MQTQLESVKQSLEGPPTFFAVGFGLWLGIFSFFKMLFDMSNEKANKVLASLLLNSPKSSILSFAAASENGVNNFVQMLDVFWDAEHPSWQVIRRLCVASAIPFTLLGIYLGVLMMSDPALSLPPIQMFSISISVSVCIGMVFVIPEYGALLVLGTLIKRYSQSPKKLLASVAALIVVTFLLVTCICFCLLWVMFVMANVLEGSAQPLLDASQKVLELFPLAFTPSGLLVTSLCLLVANCALMLIALYLSAICLLRLALGIEWMTSTIIKVVDVEKKPVLFVGGATGLLVAVAYWSISIALWLRS